MSLISFLLGYCISSTCQLNVSTRVNTPLTMATISARIVQEKQQDWTPPPLQQYFPIDLQSEVVRTSH